MVPTEWDESRVLRMAQMKSGSLIDRPGRRLRSAVDAGRPPAPRDGSSRFEAESVPLVSVIIPHLDDTENLNRCLTLLGRQAFPSHTLEIIVVDNGSRSGFESICALVGTRAKAVSASNKGAGPARNA